MMIVSLMLRNMPSKMASTSLLAMLGAISLTRAMEIPPYTGKYHVGATKQVIAVNESDILAPGNISTSFLATLFYPTLQAPEVPGTTPYLTQVTAEQFEGYFDFPNGTLANLTDRIIWGAPFAESFEEDEGYLSPTLLFTPGIGGPPCECYAIMLSELASRGYTVAALDHPYEQPYVLYPDGSEFYGPALTYAWTVPDAHAVIDARIQDILAFIEAWPARAEALGFASTTHRFGSFGHSIGGAVALEVAQMVDQSVIPSGINLDGSFWDKLNSSEADVARPSLLLGSVVHSTPVDPSWVTYPEHQTSWWRLITVNETGHTDWSDFTFWKSLNPPVQPSTGNISTDRMIEITNTFLGGFFNWTLLGKDEGELFNDPSSVFPEAVLIGGSNGTATPYA